MRNIKAVQIAESIDIKSFKKVYAGVEVSSDSSELFYKNDQERYLYITTFGVIVASGYDETKLSELLEFIKPHSKNLLNDKFTEEFTIVEDAEEMRFGYNEIHLSRFDAAVMRIVMLNVGQSVALDYFSKQTDQLLEATNLFTLQLEQKGSINLSNKALLKFIGKTLNMKNRIIDSLYVIDTPEYTWNDEYLHKVDTGLRNTFDLKIRFKDLDYSLQIVKDNLDLFKDLMHHNKSNLLEIIIIVLILIEVVNLFVSKVH
ncbi:MAG: RMD1 family protein [Breznakibacter sp.]|nr:RMD1 family protein [Breznakibacter sp.]